MKYTNYPLPLRPFLFCYSLEVPIHIFIPKPASVIFSLNRFYHHYLPFHRHEEKINEIGKIERRGRSRFRYHTQRLFSSSVFLIEDTFGNTADSTCADVQRGICPRNPFQHGYRGSCTLMMIIIAMVIWCKL